MAISMLSLPVELQLQILENLDYPSQTNLRACNRRNRDLQAITKKYLTSLCLSWNELQQKPNQDTFSCMAFFRATSV